MRALSVFLLQDTGIGMTADEMISNLGTIARSGSKVARRLLRAQYDKWYLSLV